MDTDDVWMGRVEWSCRLGFRGRPMDIDKLEAGRELDALVAEKVMGWTTFEEYGQTFWRAPNDGTRYLEPREFSTDIAAAWEVVKKLGEFRGGPHNIYKPVIRLEYYEHDGIANVSVGRCKGMEDVVADAEVWEEHGEASADQAMALAICRAALKAVGAC